MGVVGHGIDLVEVGEIRRLIDEPGGHSLARCFGEGIAFTDIEVVTLPSGEPWVALHGQAAAVASARGVTAWLVSTTHAGALAATSVVALGADDIGDLWRRE